MRQLHALFTAAMKLALKIHGALLQGQSPNPHRFRLTRFFTFFQKRIQVALPLGIHMDGYNRLHKCDIAQLDIARQ